MCTRDCGRDIPSAKPSRSVGSVLGLILRFFHLKSTAVAVCVVLDTAPRDAAAWSVGNKPSATVVAAGG